jgi:hypothetical protein
VISPVIHSLSPSGGWLWRGQAARANIRIDIWPILWGSSRGRRGTEVHDLVTA